MILLDLSQILFSNIHVAINSKDFFQKTDEEIENVIRHMVLNSIRGYRSRFASDYGEMVICVDSKCSWRHDVFEYYKNRRSISRSKSTVDWDKLFCMFNKIKGELKTVFPYKVIDVEGAEADDIIGTIIHEFNEKVKNILILSNDKDFRQLQVYKNVEQFSPVMKEFICEDTPELYLFNHIVCGDSGDDIPNIYSDDDVFMVEDKRQKPVRQTNVIATWEDNRDL